MYITLVASLLSVLVIGASGGSSIAAGQVYWNNVLPKTSMPKAIQDLLMQPLPASTTKVLPTTSLPNRNKASTAKVIPGGILIYQNKASTAASTAKVLPGGVNIQWNKAATSKELLRAHNNKGNAASTTELTTESSKSKKKIAGVEKWSYDPSIIMSMLEKDLQAGNKMTLSFLDTSAYGATFISKTESNSIPFGSSKLADILSLFSIDPESALGSAMNETLTSCEYKPMEGETKHCATSLESMVDFTTSVLGTRNLLSMSTTADKENMPKQEYEVASSNIRSSGDNTVVCHAQTYAYAVFYCHKLRKVDVYDVQMVGADGSKVDAVATCHRDTSKWDPNNLALVVLNVKPGTVPVCHFLPQYDVLWTSIQ